MTGMNNLRIMLRYIYIMVFVVAATSVFPTGSFAQIDRKDVRKGNREFRREEYREAEIDYRKALVKDSSSVAANYNLAGALYRLNDMDQAKKAMERIKESAPASSNAADYYYNLGDIAVAMKDWQGAVDAFEQALFLEPSDMAAKENYIYAKKMLQDQQNQQQDQNQQNDKQQDQNQDQDQENDKQQDQNQQNDKQQNQQDQNQDQDPQNDKQQDQERQPKITPQAAQQLLQAIQAKEKETQEKVNREKAQALKSRQKEKNW